MIPLVMFGTLQDTMMLVSPTEPSTTVGFTLCGGVEAVGMRITTAILSSSTHTHTHTHTHTQPQNS